MKDKKENFEKEYKKYVLDELYYYGDKFINEINEINILSDSSSIYKIVCKVNYKYTLNILISYAWFEKFYKNLIYEELFPYYKEYIIEEIRKLDPFTYKYIYKQIIDLKFKNLKDFNIKLVEYNFLLKESIFLFGEWKRFYSL